jgi:parallel beta-helix repeat protein
MLFSTTAKRANIVLFLCFVLCCFLFTPGSLLAFRDNFVIEEPEEPPIEEPSLDCETGIDSGFFAMESQLFQNNPGALPPAAPQNSSPYYIAIAFHFVHMDNGSGGLDESQAQTILDDINALYAPAGFIFVFTAPVDHINNTYYYSDREGESALHSLNWVSNAINVYFTSSLPYYTGGYTSGIGSGSTWAIINNIHALNGMTCPHEVGHILYLYHTHQGYNECTDGTDCDILGDRVCDTPADPKLSSGNVTNCVYDGDDVPPCGALPYNPDVSNIMSYAPGSCREDLTAGQFARAEYYLTNNLSFLFTDPPPRTIYVDAVNGSNDNYGTEEYPYATIQKAVTESNDGDVVLVLPGGYDPFNIIGKSIYVRSSDGPQATIITTNQSEYLCVIRDCTTGQSTVEGFTMLGGRQAFYILNASPTVRYNICDGQGYAYKGAIYLDIYCGNAIIENNTILNGAHAGIQVEAAGQVTLRNNIITFCQFGIYWNDNGDDPVIEYNNVWENPAWPNYPPPGYEPLNYYGDAQAGTGCISADPLLTNDYGLSFGSPSIDAGDPDPAYNDPDGTRNDMGAVPGIVYPTPVHVYVGESIQAAVDNASSGGTIYVHAGEWFEGFRYNGKTLKIIGIDGPENTIMNAGAWGYIAQIDNYEGPGTEFSGFTVTNQYGFVNDVQVGVGSHAIIQNCIFKNKPSSTLSPAQNIAVGSSTSGDILITRNLFYNNDTHDCIKIFGGLNNVTIVNNTFDNNKRAVVSYAAGTIFKNNIVTNSYEDGVVGTYAELDYNDVWGNATDYSGGAAAGANDIAADPRYVSSAEENYGLLVHSPCLDAGDPDSVYNDPDGTRNDMGAYWGANTLPKPPLVPLKETGSIPDKFTLFQNNPNPFNPVTEISFNLPEAAYVKLEIFNMLGQKINTIIDGYIDAGYQSALWNGKTSEGSTVASGIYFYRLSTDKYVESRKMILLK